MHVTLATKFSSAVNVFIPGGVILKKTDPWLWLPPAFLAEGGPYMIVSVVSGIFFKTLGMSNAALAFWTGLIMLPWAVKPLWSPLLDLFGTKRQWILALQAGMAVLLFLIGVLLLTRPSNALFIGAFAVLALASATHDIAVDGFYLIALNSHEQAFFSGLRGTFYRFGAIGVQGGLVMLAGMVERAGGTIHQSWAAAMGIGAAAMGVVYFWDLCCLPRCESQQMKAATSNVPEGAEDHCGALREFFGSFLEFFRKPGVWALVAFLLFFRIAEAQLSKLAGVFLIEPVTAGGLGMPLDMQGFLYGTVGSLALLFGGIAGGLFTSRFGFGKTIWFLVCAINLPDIVYVYLATTQTQNLWIAGICIAIEQFGYGLGYMAMVLVMIAATEDSGRYKTSHFAIMTGISILMLTLFGMVSGWIEERLGYRQFFWYVMICTIPSFLVTIPVARRIRPDFGRKERSAPEEG